MKHRKLRIAWSVAWGMLVAILVSLNVWSCWWWDRCYVQGGSTGIQLSSDAGHTIIVIGPSQPTVHQIIFGHLPSPGSSDLFYANDVLGFYFKRISTSLRIDIPYWFLALFCVAIAVLPWLDSCSKRFSLRTLLITTTLVAVGLGLIVWLR
jgi:hypothetical protein